MFCPKCKTEMFGGSLCHLCGGSLVLSERSLEGITAKGGVEIRTRKKHKVTKEFGQTLVGHVARLLIEIVIFCTAFILLSFAVVEVANWLSKEMALNEQRVKLIDIYSVWMKYFWYIGCGVIVFLSVKLRFKPGK